MSDEVADLMRRQHGIVSRSQALAAGLSAGQIQHRVADGRWISVYRGVYRNAAMRATWHGGLLAACLVVDGLASHRSAAVLHGIDGFQPGRKMVVVARGRHRRSDRVPDVVVHETTQLDLAHATVREGIPCTGLARTLLDLAGCVTRRKLGIAVDGELRRTRLTLADLYDVLVRQGRSGRPGCGRLRDVLDERLGEGAVPLSDWSRMVADLLVASGLPRPTYEHRVMGPGGELVAQVDLAYPNQTLAIELDSVGFHLNRASFERDPLRRNRLVMAGWTVLSFTWSHYVDDPAGLCATVAAALSVHRGRDGGLGCVENGD
jgi:hypothetical protein